MTSITRRPGGETRQHVSSMENADRLQGEALDLPDSERADLAAKLIDSLDSSADASAAAAWDDKIGRRIAELDRGTIRAAPWNKARQMIGNVDGAVRI